MNLKWTTPDRPHGFLCEIPIHLVYRVHGCAPVKKLREISDELKGQLKILRSFEREPTEQIEKVLDEHFEAYDALLDAQDQSKYVLNDQSAADIVIQSWLTLQERGEVIVYAICVMGNHVHVILRGPDGVEPKQIGDLVHRHKTYTSKLIKETLDRSERTWDYGFYDRYVRPGTFWEVLDYLLNNPVAAGLVLAWQDWPKTYLDERCKVRTRSRG